MQETLDVDQHFHVAPQHRPLEIQLFLPPLGLLRQIPDPLFVRLRQTPPADLLMDWPAFQRLVGEYLLAPKKQVAEQRPDENLLQ